MKLYLGSFFAICIYALIVTFLALYHLPELTSNPHEALEKAGYFADVLNRIGNWFTLIFLIWADWWALKRVIRGWQMHLTLWTPLLFFMFATSLRWFMVSEAIFHFKQRHGLWIGEFSAVGFIYLFVIYPVFALVSGLNYYNVMRYLRRREK